MPLTDNALIRTQGLIDGAWVHARSNATVDVSNPATRQVVGPVPDMGEADTAEAIAAAERAFGPWKRTSHAERAARLMAWHDLILAHAEDLARILAEGAESAEGPQYVRPVVIGEATTEMLLASEETFGPVAPLFRFRTEDEAIANGTPFGLAAYFDTESLSRSWRVGEELEFGMVGLNTGAIATEVAPFGGIKQSGLGREGSSLGIEEYLEVKTFHRAGLCPTA